MRKFGRILKYIFRALCLILVFGTTAILVLRIVFSNDPQTVKTLLANDDLRAAYAESGGDLTAYWQELDTITRGDENYGYFSVTRALFIKEAQQVQVTFRYNNSTLEHLKEDYQLEAAPEREEDVYDVSLLVAYDMTPDDPADQLKENPEGVRYVRYFPDEEPMLRHEHNVYNYRKFVFSDVELDGEQPILTAWVDIYYNEDVDYEKDSYGTLIVYHDSRPIKEYKLTGQDKAALE